MNAAPVTAVIVSYNSRGVIASALDSLRSAHESGILAECLVIDNHSADATSDFVKREHAWCKFLQNRENLGFGRACNIGFACARTPYVLLLNPDATLAEIDLRRLVAFLESTPAAGVAAPAIREPNGDLQPAGGLLTPRGLLREAITGTVSDDRQPIIPGTAPFRTNWVCGAVALLRTTMLDQLGGFDPRYFLYFEETDLWRRAQHAGWELWAVGEAVGTHVKAASATSVGRELYFGCVAEYYFRSRFRYLAAHFGWPAAAGAELLELGLTWMRALVWTMKGRDLAPLRTRLNAPVLGGVAREPAA
jgi:N-acetylglucosaminyl-diphospho-decaprenol L-rhamnosyltransferase